MGNFWAFFLIISISMAPGVGSLLYVLRKYETGQWPPGSGRPSVVTGVFEIIYMIAVLAHFFTKV